MSWIKLDDRFFSHRKVINLSKGAKLLFLCATAHSASNLLDGRLTPVDVRICAVMVDAGTKEVDELIESGLFCREGIDVLIHDYHDYNPTAANVRSRLHAAKERMTCVRSRDRSQNVRANTQRTNDECSQNIRSPDPIQSYPILKKEKENIKEKDAPFGAPSASPPELIFEREEEEEERSTASSPPAFEAFWASYPKKRAKDRALKAWAKRNFKPPDVANVMAGLERCKMFPDWLKEGGEFIPHPASWLNAGGWMDVAGSDREASRPDLVPVPPEVANSPGYLAQLEEKFGFGGKSHEEIPLPAL